MTETLKKNLLVQEIRQRKGINENFKYFIKSFINVDLIMKKFGISDLKLELHEIICK
jgi:hypothetical protein